MTRYHHLVEIGAGDSHSSQAWPLSVRAEKVTLFEPNVILRRDLERATAGLAHITVRPEAVLSPEWDSVLFHIGYASFARGAFSFLRTSVEPDYEHWWGPLAREVPTFRAVDLPLDIDALVLTIGGGERSILNYLVARPKVIWTKHYCHNAAQWAEAQRVFDWMAMHRYTGKVLASNQHSTFLSAQWTLDTVAQPG